MIVDLLQTLRSAATGLMDGSALGPREGYEAASSAVLGMALATLADQFDGAVAAYVEENAALRALHAEGAAVARDDALRRRLAEAASGHDPDLCLSTLRTANDALRALLIDLHAWLETAQGDAERRLEARLWAELARSTERRRVALAPF